VLNMQIRPATPEDAGVIAAIHVSSSRAVYDGVVPDETIRAFTVERREASWREILITREADVWIAEYGTRDLGWICVGKSRDPDAEPRTAELWAMYIEPASWRRGIGRALWAHAEGFLRSENYCRVTLWALQDNARALAFYRAVGFAEDPGYAIKRDRGGVELVEIRLRRELSRRATTA
jgi:ribosomal protein S18 acetylase RimI-like enzyme